MKEGIAMLDTNRLTAVIVVMIYVIFSLSANCLAEQTLHPKKNNPAFTKTLHPPGAQTSREEEISQPPKWPWFALGGLVVAVVAIFALGGGGGDSSSPTAPDTGSVTVGW